MFYFQPCLVYAYKSTYSKVLRGQSRNSSITTHSTKLCPKGVLRMSPNNFLWMSPSGPLCNGKVRPLPTFWGRPLSISWGRWNMKSWGHPNVTSWGRPHIALDVTSRDVPYRRLLDVPCTRYDVTLSQHLLDSVCNHFSHAWNITETITITEKCSHSSSTLSSRKKIGHIPKNEQKNKCVCIHEIIRLIIMQMKMKLKNRSHR